MLVLPAPERAVLLSSTNRLGGWHSVIADVIRNTMPK